MQRPFRMLTLKQILAQIQPEDWFLSVDLKDAYFHIQIAPRSHIVLGIHFSREWPISTRSFHWTVSGPSETDGICILNYIDDWLMQVTGMISHRSLLLNHLERLGLKCELG